MQVSNKSTYLSHNARIGMLECLNVAAYASRTNHAVWNLGKQQICMYNFTEFLKYQNPEKVFQISNYWKRYDAIKIKIKIQIFILYRISYVYANFPLYGYMKFINIYKSELS